MAGLLGPNQLAASSIIMQLIVIMFMLPLSVSSAASTRCGNFLGQNQPAAAKNSARTAMWLTASLATGLLAFTVAVQDLWPRLFTDDDTVRHMASHVLPLIAFSQWFDCLQVNSNLLASANQYVCWSLRSH